MAPRPILYAEDDENDAFLVEYAFQQAGIRNPLTIVPDGAAAIAYLSGPSHPSPCLVLLDLKMPGQSGLEVLKWIRTHPGLSTLPVLMLTSSNQDRDVYLAYSLGANAYLEKPRNPNDLVILAKAIRDFWLTLNCSNEGCSDD